MSCNLGLETLEKPFVKLFAKRMNALAYQLTVMPNCIWLYLCSHSSVWRTETSSYCTFFNEWLLNTDISIQNDFCHIECVSIWLEIHRLPGRSYKSSPTSPGSGKNMPLGISSSSLSPKVPKVTISEVNSNAGNISPWNYVLWISEDNISIVRLLNLCLFSAGKIRPYDRPFKREESFESVSTRTQSSGSGGSVPQILVNHW